MTNSMRKFYSEKLVRFSILVVAIIVAADVVLASLFSNFVAAVTPLVGVAIWLAFLNRKEKNDVLYNRKAIIAYAIVVFNVIIMLLAVSTHSVASEERTYRVIGEKPVPSVAYVAEEVPVQEAPTTVPAVEAPATVPAVEAPATVPTVEVPATVPTVEAPATVPAEETPVHQEATQVEYSSDEIIEADEEVVNWPTVTNPVQEIPVVLDFGSDTQTPAQQEPVQQTPAQETPAQETPAQETPVQETPAQETPAQETPAQETPAQETPAQETPAQETPVENPTQNPDELVDYVPDEQENNVEYATVTSVSTSFDGTVMTATVNSTIALENMTVVDATATVIAVDGQTVKIQLPENMTGVVAVEISASNLENSYTFTAEYSTAVMPEEVIVPEEEVVTPEVVWANVNLTWTMRDSSIVVTVNSDVELNNMVVDSNFCATVMGNTVVIDVTGMTSGMFAVEVMADNMVAPVMIQDMFTIDAINANYGEEETGISNIISQTVENNNFSYDVIFASEHVEGAAEKFAVVTLNGTYDVNALTFIAIDANGNEYVLTNGIDYTVSGNVVYCYVSVSVNAIIVR